MITVLPLQVDVWSLLTDVSLGTWLGFVVTLITSVGVYLLRRSQQKTKLRRSLISELEEQDLDRVIKAVNSSESAVPPDDNGESPELDPSELPPAGTLPTQIYTSNAGSLGILSQDEVDDIVSYYSGLLTQKAIINSIRSDNGSMAADQKELRDKITDLEDERSSLVDTLENAKSIR
ncbi:hypothetical protein [Halorubrum aquaticum]|uniref:hypothetical protein n=1 Tax=Halorubrum aquaticum TaxID=387340 RepID=UPI00122C31BB|nr:hypothetical protein [Halorubrum aquaticum]